jgi:hypothetical protein
MSAIEHRLSDAELAAYAHVLNVDADALVDHEHELKMPARPKGLEPLTFCPPDQVEANEQVAA